MAYVAREVGSLARSVASSLTSLTNTSAKLAAGGRANQVSKEAQSAQGQFNAAQAAIANDINAQNLAAQYEFNSGQAAIANAFTENMWQKTADWNERMWQKAADWNENMMNKTMDFNAQQAQINRDWQERMSNTSYQRAMADMKAAGLNPVLAYGGSANVGSGSAASVGGTSVGAPSVSSASGAMASGGLLGANKATESNYSGQLEYMGGLMGMLGNALGSIGSAVAAWRSSLSEPTTIKIINQTLKDVLGEDHVGDSEYQTRKKIYNRKKPETYNYLPGIDQ